MNLNSATEFSDDLTKTVSGTVNGSRFYACIITVATVLLFGLLLWPLSVQTFRSTASFEIGYDSSTGLDKSALNQLVTSAMRDATRPEITVDMIQGLKSPIKSPILRSPDSEKLRNVILIKGRPGRNANSIEYQVELRGSGGNDEVEFLNALVVKINSVLDHQVAGNTAKLAVTELSNEFSRFHSVSIEQFASQVNEVLSRIETADNDLQIISNDLSNWQPDSSGLFNDPRSRLNAQGNGAELDRLVAEKNRLLSQPGVTAYHYQVTALQKQIEALQNGSGAISSNASFQIPAGSNATSIRNQFVSANGTGAGSTAAQPDAVVSKVAREISSINLKSSVCELGTLSQNLIESGHSANVLTKRMAERAGEKVEVTSPIVMQDFRKATNSLPVGGVPTGRSFLYLALFAGLIGACVALNYDPALNVRRFRSLDHLQNCIGIPVIGTIRSTSNPKVPRPTSRWLAAKAVRIGEWTLLIAVVLLFVTALFNSQVALAFLENPFHGITRTVWMMTSHG